MAQHPMYAPAGNSPVIHRPRAPSAPRAYPRDNRQLVPLGTIDFEARAQYHGFSSPMDSHGHMIPQPTGRVSYPPAGQPITPVPMYSDWNPSPHMSHEPLRHDIRPLNPSESPEYIVERNSRRASDASRGGTQYISQRRSSNRDEFDGPHQILDAPSSRNLPAREEELPQLPTNLDAAEQDRILHEVNDRLSQCAFDFFARYQFPIPIEQDKRRVQVPSDREWNEWVHLLKRLATRRRIPRHALHNGQIKQLITVLENSLEMRHAAKHSSRPVKDDRNVLQLISAGTQVAKILKDSSAMQFFDCLYVDTEKLISERRRRVRFADH
ncbi:uncharacterized protein N7473_007672 [Penicillium subrubescens]|uniref:uncharacterized protein n=1 Tax=Penicillium subrubescens TaxID=1316194 RepID=UPI002544D8FA|nr:uncharacterized protein N7473_007672 [Penicillium subrubescens]KAJ5891444.1 hypothetical protein N7473_007672 [Penicillium subrubescens]